ncbi:MAG: TatD family hydrolase [Pseudomonadota bacterium]
MLVDHHCHLDFDSLSRDLDGVMARAREAGVGLMVTISTRVATFPHVRAIAESYGNVFCSVGTHPHNADDETHITPAQLASFADHPKVVAIGEAGLDYHYQKSTRENQAHGFRVHIEAARLTGLPLVIHARDADDDTAVILEEEMARAPFKAVLHCYTGGMDLAQRALALGLYIGFTGVVTFKNSQALREIARMVPLERMLVETDAPYLAPVPFRGKPNEPAYVKHTAAALADVKGISTDAFAAATTDNFFRLYDKTPRAALQDAAA